MTGRGIGIGTGIAIGTVRGTARGTAIEIGPEKETVGTAIGMKETTEPRPEKTAETRDTKAIPLAIEVLKRTLVTTNCNQTSVYFISYTSPALHTKCMSFSGFHCENTLAV